MNLTIQLTDGIVRAMDEMDFVDWVNYGVEQGWCTPIYCDTHEGPQLTEEEAAEWDEGGDPCLPVMRIW